MADKFDMNEFRSIINELQGAINGLRMSLTGESEKTIAEEEAYREEYRKNAEAHKKNTDATKDNTTAKKASTIALKGLKDMAAAAAKEFVNVGKEGIKFGQAIGVSATRGVQLEINNRKAVAAQLFSFNTDLQVTIEQLKATQQGFTDTFIGAAEGMQISARGSLEVASSLKKGFKSEFEPTAETFRILTQMGMSTTTQFEAFRKATGRASLSNNQLATLYNKNSLSFLLYGNSFAKAAVNAEKLGINLASVQGAQEGLVTNLDGTIDTVAQLNQLGAQIDFSNLVRVAEQEGPDALLSYVRQVIPEQLMQSASTRALFKQLGISVEDYIKSGQTQVSAANSLERQMTETATATGMAAQAAATLARKDQILTDAFGELYTTTRKVIGALIGLAASAVAASISNVFKSKLPGTPPIPPGSPGVGMGMASRLGLGAAGVTVGVGGTLYGASKVEEGKTGIGTSIGLGAGALGALLTGIAVLGAIPTGGASLALLAAGGAVGAAGAYGIGTARKRERATQLGMTLEEYEAELDKKNKGQPNRLPPTEPVIPANDLYSSGYGSRVLVTPSKTFALNNTDDVIAGTQLFSKGSLGLGLETNNYTTERLQRDTSELLRKVQTLIDTLATATTTVTINNNTQKIPRMQLVSVHSRNEVV
jgi:hypothetical protein